MNDDLFLIGIVVLGCLGVGLTALGLTILLLESNLLAIIPTMIGGISLCIIFYILIKAVRESNQYYT